MEQKISIIGFGSMGSMISRNLLSNSIVDPCNLYISNRTKEKTKNIKSEFTDVHIVDNCTAVEKADIIILCVKPKDFKGLLNEIRPFLKPQKHLVSITATIPILKIEEYHNGPISIAIPTVTGEVGRGYSLLLHNYRVSNELKKQLLTIFSSLGKVKEVEPEMLEIMVEITSCTPGFIAALFSTYLSVLQEFIKDLGFEEDVEKILIETIKGTLDLTDKSNMSFDEIASRVATKGGITKVGIKIIREKMPDIFKQIINDTLEKRKQIKDQYLNV